MSITVTLIIIIVTGLVSWQAFRNRDFFYSFMHYPFEEQNDKEYYRWFTSMFLHSNIAHLAINMFVLWGFGLEIEYRFEYFFGPIMGKINFLALYFFSGIFADVPTFYKHKNNPSFSSVGASGAISGIMFAYILLSPWKLLGLFFFIPVPAVIAGLLYLVYSSYSARQEAGSRIDHEAHFWGAVFGFVFTIILKPALFSSFIDQIINGIPF